MGFGHDATLALVDPRSRKPRASLKTLKTPSRRPSRSCAGSAELPAQPRSQSSARSHLRNRRSQVRILSGPLRKPRFHRLPKRDLRRARFRRPSRRCADLGHQATKDHRATIAQNPIAHPESRRLRYWDGARWTDSYHPGQVVAGPSHREFLWGLSLGFGALGAGTALGVPLIAYYFPLGCGLAAALLGLFAVLAEGKTPP